MDLGLDVSSFADYDITLEDSNLYRKKRRKRSRIRRSSNSESINTDMFESEAEKFKFLNDHIFTEYTIDNIVGIKIVDKL